MQRSGSVLRHWTLIIHSNKKWARFTPIARPLHTSKLVNKFKNISEGATRRKYAVAARGVTAAHVALGTTATSSITSALAVVVGWLVIAGSTVRSLPQILRILRNKSVDGLSLTSFVSELAAYTVSVAYNVRFQYAFSTWGDTLMSAAQHAFLLGLIFNYSKSIKASTKFFITASFATATIFLFSGACSVQTLKFLQASCMVLLALGGRMPQILLNLKRGNSGELSIISTGLSASGNLARVFTTITLVKDPIILATACSQLVLNSILLYQTLDTARQERQLLIAAAVQPS